MRRATRRAFPAIAASARGGKIQLRETRTCVQAHMHTHTHIYVCQTGYLRGAGVSDKNAEFTVRMCAFAAFIPSCGENFASPAGWPLRFATPYAHNSTWPLSQSGTRFAVFAVRFVGTFLEGNAD